MDFVLATFNPGKVRELGALLAAPGRRLLSLSDFPGAAAPAETGTSLIENARLKARAAMRHTGLPAIADDTGLEVDALGGEPGHLAARFAGPEGDSAANTARLLERLRGIAAERRTARFRTVCVACFPDGRECAGEGVLEGRIAVAPRGSGGFGYDPVFEVAGTGRTLAELDEGAKNALSHRARAVQALARPLEASRQGRRAGPGPGAGLVLRPRRESSKMDRTGPPAPIPLRVAALPIPTMEPMPPPVPVNAAARPAGPMVRLWQRAGGPLLTLAVWLVPWWLGRPSWWGTDVAIVGLIPVVYSVYAGGRASGVVSAALNLAFALLRFTRGDHPLSIHDEEFRGLAMILVTTPAVTALACMLRDRERRRSAARAAAVDGALDAIVTIDHRGRITEFNPAAESTFGYRREDAIGRPMVDLIVPPGLRARHDQGLARHLATGESTMLGRRVEMTAMRADGTEFPVELAISRVPASDPPVFTGFVRDITERRRVEDDLRGTLSLLSATLESTTDGILVVDPEGHIVSLNRRFATMWRIPQNVIDSRDDDQAIAFVLSQLRDPDAFVAKVREVYRQPDSESFDVLEFKDDRVFERYSMPRRIDGRSVGRVWSFRDVTERRRTEIALRERDEELRQAQKMDAIGRLAGGVAHDFNNLLTVILGYTDQMLAQLGPRADDPMAHAAVEIQSAAERASALTRQLLAFSRKQILEPRELDLNATLSATSQLLRRLIGEHIALDVRLMPGLGHVLADENQMQQVVMNLAINARDAMPEGGRLTLGTAVAELCGGDAERPPRLPPGRYVMLTVADTGVGMDAETRTRIFEPFFTTKERGKGTGLGLATVYGIVKQSGGDITVASEPGRGSVFTIYLPRLEASGVARPELAATGPTPSGTETVLLVEDEAMVRDLLRGMLETLGYQPLATASGDEALEVAAARPGPIHLMVTDVVMPGVSGPELAQRLKPLHPELRVLFISGHTDDSVLRHGVSEGLAAFLQKPFTIDAFARKLRDVLDAEKVS